MYCFFTTGLIRNFCLSYFLKLKRYKIVRLTEFNEKHLVPCEQLSHIYKQIVKRTIEQSWDMKRTSDIFCLMQ